MFVPQESRLDRQNWGQVQAAGMQNQQDHVMEFCLKGHHTQEFARDALHDPNLHGLNLHDLNLHDLNRHTLNPHALTLHGRNPLVTADLWEGLVNQVPEAVEEAKLGHLLEPRAAFALCEEDVPKVVGAVAAEHALWVPTEHVEVDEVEADGSRQASIVFGPDDDQSHELCKKFTTLNELTINKSSSNSKLPSTTLNTAMQNMST